jgi:deoxyribonuclease I
LLILLISPPSRATSLRDPISYYPSSFYAAVENGLNNDSLKDLIHEVLSKTHIMGKSHDEVADRCPNKARCSKHVSLGYSRARKILFGELHLQFLDDDQFAVQDVYCQITTTTADYRRGQPPGPGQIPDPRLLNTEHTWPQSKFSRQFPTDIQKSDLHILFPVLARANSSRGNIPFGDVVTQQSSPCPKSRRGFTASGTSQPHFEVPDDHKGNAARAVFYFAIRYKLRIQPTEEDSLKAWHRADPVDQAEAARNESIFAHQSVRNPFIDHPELVELIADF